MNGADNSHRSVPSQFRVWSLPWQKLRNDAGLAAPAPQVRCESEVRGYGGNADTIVPFAQAGLVVSSASDGTVSGPCCSNRSIHRSRFCSA